MSSISTTTKEGGFAIITIKREPVNSMDLDMWKDLTKALDSCEGNPSIRGIIITSGLTKKPIFTAGNDLKELYAPATSHQRYKEFWKTSNVFLARLYASHLVTVAAVDGYCPAGGTCLAMACDVRVCAENVSMGLNEVKLGISVPLLWTKLMATLIGQGKMEKLVMFSQMVSAKEGQKMGLVDYVVESKNELIPTATGVIQKLLKLPDSGRVITKKSMRDSLAAEWMDDTRLDQESEMAWFFLSQDQTVQALSKVFEKLGGSAKSKL